MSRGVGNSTEFTLDAPLPPSGITVLEASAGTGKTYTIAGLVTRYLAQGIAIENLLIVTFTVAAAAELRSRVRQRIVDAVFFLERQLQLRAEQTEDAVHQERVERDGVLAALSDGAIEDVRARCDYLVQALRDFDSAMITTIHGFCENALAGLGLAGDSELNPTFQPNLADLADQVALDLYIQEFSERRVDELTCEDFTIAQARELIREVTNHPDAVIEPQTPEPVRFGQALAGFRVQFALRGRDLVSQRKRAAAVMTFSDQILRLRNAVLDPVRGGDANTWLRQRFQVVLVDEFQDTDLVQWEVLSTVFATDVSTLWLIGDPKQAIYAFRGADINAYLAAVERATNSWTLSRNFRTDAQLIEALNTFFGTRSLGDDAIRYRPVSSAAEVNDAKLVTPALRIRVADAQTPFERSDKGWIPKSVGVANVAKDLAADIVTRLRSGTVRPSQIGVIVGLNREADIVHAALRDCAVPAVIRGTRSIFSTRSAADVCHLLDALDQPDSTRAIRRLSVTALIGLEPRDLANQSEPVRARADQTGQARQGNQCVRLSELSANVAQWSAEFTRSGIASVFASVKAKYGLLRRLLGDPEGEREVTDLEQLIELVHKQEIASHESASSLSAWVRQRIAESDEDNDRNERSRRLDSDADAVQVITIHASKGLEFDVVYCPFLWCAPFDRRNQTIFRYHHEGRRSIHVAGTPSPGAQHARNAQLTEALGERLRLAYVAMTRARHELVLWWVPTYHQKHSALSRLVEDVPGESTEDRLRSIASGSPNISLRVISQIPAVQRWEGLEECSESALVVNKLTRTFDGMWGRTSFTGLTVLAHGAVPHDAFPHDAFPHDAFPHSSSVVESEPELAAPVVSDEPDGPAESLGESPAPADDTAPSIVADSDIPPVSSAEEVRLRARRSLMADLPGGATFGSFVHAIFETIDFDAVDTDVQIDHAIHAQAHRWSIDPAGLGQLRDALRAALDTPLGRDLTGITLREIHRRDRLDEMAFEYELAGGDDPRGAFNITQVRDVLEATLASDDPLRGYLPSLNSSLIDQDVRGFLTGSVDLVLRVNGPRGLARYSVVDYKTNRLGGDDLSAWDYRPESLRAAVFRSHYPLQFLLYVVALHRYLSVRLPDYDPAINLGPVKYLFMRGMFGVDNPVIDSQPCGVFSWSPPTATVLALSEVIGSGGGVESE